MYFINTTMLSNLNDTPIYVFKQKIKRIKQK